MSSLPSKGARDQVIDALNIWLKVPRESIDVIKAISHRLHNVSLMYVWAQGPQVFKTLCY